MEELRKLVTVAYNNEGGVELARELSQAPFATNARTWILLRKCFLQEATMCVRNGLV